jgi:hypothetical protein
MRPAASSTIQQGPVWVGLLGLLGLLEVVGLLGLLEL